MNHARRNRNKRKFQLRKRNSAKLNSRNLKRAEMFWNTTIARTIANRRNNA